MLVAKSDEAHWRVARQFENRTIQKTYLALVHGIPSLRSDVIDMPIGKDRYVREKQAVRKEENGGKPAVTLYEVLERFEMPAAASLETGSFPADRNKPRPPEKFSFVRLTPKTGRTTSRESIWPQSAIRWWATRCTAGGCLFTTTSVWDGKPCTRRRFDSSIQRR